MTNVLWNEICQCQVSYNRCQCSEFRILNFINFVFFYKQMYECINTSYKLLGGGVPQAVDSSVQQVLCFRAGFPLKKTFRSIIISTIGCNILLTIMPVKTQMWRWNYTNIKMPYTGIASLLGEFCICKTRVSYDKHTFILVWLHLLGKCCPFKNPSIIKMCRNIQCVQPLPTGHQSHCWT